jgi:hypothetical protein
MSELNENSYEFMTMRRESRTTTMPDPNDAMFVNNLGNILANRAIDGGGGGGGGGSRSGVGGGTGDENIEEIQDLDLKKSCFLKIPGPKKQIGLHSFSRRLYRDVPDLFDVLKKLFFKIQYYVDRLNPEVSERTFLKINKLKVKKNTLFQLGLDRSEKSRLILSIKRHFML